MTTVTDTVVESLFTFKNIAKPFVADGNTVKIRNAVILRHVNGVTIINSAVRASLSIEETETFDFMMMELMRSERVIQRVASFGEFFDGSKQFEKIVNMSADEALSFSDSLGIGLHTTDIGIIKSFNTVKQHVIDFFGNMKSPYPFAEVPTNKLEQLERHTEYGSKYVRNRHGYKVTEKQFSNIWTRARKVWAEGEKDDGKATVRVDAYTSRKINVNAEKVTIGCQTAPRWAVEQMALELGLID